MTDAIVSEVKRDQTGKFIVPPVSPGRPKGARNKLGEAFIEALQQDFAAHGIAAVQQVREEKPDQYLKVIASLMPKEMTLNLNEDRSELSDAELVDRIRNLTEALAPILVGGTGSTERAAIGKQGAEKPH